VKNYFFSLCVVTKLCLQVAECGEGGEMAGVIRACIKTVTRGSSGYVKLAYILGLRVSPSHRPLSFSKKLFVLLCFPDHLHLITSLPLLD
jgi:hypothetical protein